MLPSSQKFVILLICCAGLAACGSPEPTPSPTPRADQAAPPALAPRAFLPMFAAPGAARRVLFVNGDHIPESGYPHSRVRDDGSKPESFSRLRGRAVLAFGESEGDYSLC